MWASLLVPVLSASLAGAAVPPESYDRWTAEEKVSWWNKNLDIGKGGSKTPANFMKDNPPNCMHAECIHPGGFNTRKDVVDKYHCRSKGLHPTGIVAWVKATWKKNKYTGMFQKADYGFARWGFQFYDDKMVKQVMNGYAYNKKKQMKPMNASDPTANWTTVNCQEYDCFNLSQGYIYDYSALTDDLRPSKQQFMALKFFRDSVPSAAIHTGFNGLPSWNHISKNYSNFLMNWESKPNDTSAGSMNEQGAERGTKWPGFTGLHDMAMFDQAGKLQHNIKFPHQIIFTARSPQAIPESPHGDYRETVELAEEVLKPGTLLYDIYVKDSFAAKLEKIGTLELASKIMVSADTDRQIFFYHPRYDRDLVLRPDLSQGHHCKTWWFCPVCPAVEEFCNPTSMEMMIFDYKQDQFLKKNKNLKAAIAIRMSTESTNTTGTLPSLAEEDPPPWRSWGERGPPPVSCGYAGSRNARESELQVQVQLPNPRKVAGKLRGGGQLQPDSAKPTPKSSPTMLDDDVTVEPRSGLMHTSEWFCDGSKPTWPQGPRDAPWHSKCEAKKVWGRPQAEPEYALDKSCDNLPFCNKRDGTWYSGTYPCRCGKSTCQSGELCFAHDSECVPWGPYAKSKKASVA